MRASTAIRLLPVLLACGLAACASLPENPVRSPHVTLSDVQVVGLGFKAQTFLLSFDVDNPNPFPLPVRDIGYELKLDGQRFASGETASRFTVPAGGSSSFSLSVDLNLVQTSPQLLFVIRDGARGEIRYELEGRFGVDMPLAPSVRYRSSGPIRLDPGVR